MGKRIICTLPKHEGEWIERADEISLGFWNQFKQWDFDATLNFLFSPQFAEIIVDWNLTGADGKLAPKPKDDERATENLGVRLNTWIIHQIAESIAEDFKLSPNESEPPSE